MNRARGTSSKSTLAFAIDSMHEALGACMRNIAHPAARDVGRIRTNTLERGPESAELGLHSVHINFGRHRPRLAPHRPKTDRVRANFGGFRANFGRIRPTLVQHRPNPGPRIRANSAGPRPKPANSGPQPTMDTPLGRSEKSAAFGPAHEFGPLSANFGAIAAKLRPSGAAERYLPPNTS